jgi:hypothetical protein
MPYLVRIAGLRYALPLTRLQPLSAVKQVIAVQDSVDRGRCEIDHVFSHHHPGKSALSFPGVSFGVSYRCFYLLRQN